jgi:hypothetical protein
MDYASLLAMVKNDHSLIDQLPLEYQQHFNQLLGIPLAIPVAPSAAADITPVVPVVAQAAVEIIQVPTGEIVKIES